MKPLHEDQIHAPAFQKISDYIYAESNKDYELSVIKEHNQNLKTINVANWTANSGVIFVGMCHLLEDIMSRMPEEGNYIIIHRTNDRPFTERMYKFKPKSVKHIYTVDCQVTAADVTAIPFGNASIMGEDNIIKEVINRHGLEGERLNKIFCRYNTNSETLHRNDSLIHLIYNNIVTYIDKQIPQDEFHAHCLNHKYVMALAGCGADASRQWSSIQLGAIPIVTDCPEMRHFEDLPLIFCPKNFKDLTLEYLESHDLTNRSTDRMRMSYWIEHIKNKRKELGI